jgi:cytochrome c-type biogenesis protein CcmH
VIRLSPRRSPLASDAFVPGSGMRDSGFGRASPASGLLRVIFVALLVCASFVHAQAIEPMPFASHAQELRFQHLTRELRCPMCQNETLADSNAPIARDLRNQIFRMMQQGRSDGEIKQYLVARYSRFVLYDPPLTAGTWLLWFGPLLILLGGAGAVLIAIRRRSRGINATDNGPTDNGDDW